MANNNGYDELYKQLMDAESMFSNPSSYTGNMMSYDGEDEFEDFLTSKELNPKLDKREKSLGLVGTSDGPIEEETYFKRFKTNYEHKYTEAELNKMRESCVGTIVHDYSETDIYHMSDEYRREHDMLAELSDKLQKVKGTYRKVDAWVEAMRVVVQAWELLESKGNYVHSRQEFFELVAAGKIVSNRLIMPKLKKMNNYDMDILIKYISNPELDPADLLPIETAEEDSFYSNLLVEDREDYKEYHKEYIESHIEEYEEYCAEYIESLSDYDLDNVSEEDIKIGADQYAREKMDRDADKYARDKLEEDEMMRLLSPEEVAYIIEHRDNPEKFKVNDIKPKMIKGYDKKSFHSYGKKKKKGKRKKDKIKQYQIESLHEILNKIQSDPNNRSEYGYNRSFMVANSMFEPVKPPKNFLDDIVFDGSWTDDDALFLYDLAIREEMLKQHPTRSKYMTFGDQELQQFFKLLEENGVNTLNLRRKMGVPVDGGSKAIEEKATKKENKKMESILIQRITKLNSSPKFKKLVTKAEDALNKQFSEY